MMPRLQADQQPYDPTLDGLYDPNGPDDNGQSDAPLSSTPFNPSILPQPVPSSGSGMDVGPGMDMSSPSPTGFDWRGALNNILGGGSGTGPQGSPVDTVRTVAKSVAPILGNAAKGKAAAQDINDQATFRNRQLEIKAPGMRIANAAKAHLLSAGPSSASWGGPGSGLRGETVKFSGGASSGFDPADKTMMDNLVHQQLQKALTGEDLPQPGRSSAADKLLGDGATAASLLGALLKSRNPGNDQLPNNVP